MKYFSHFSKKINTNSTLYRLILGAVIDISQYCVGDYPIVLGSKTNSSGDTEFTSMDVDANGNLVLAGYSKDIIFRPSAERLVWPLIVLYDGLNVLKWIKQSSVQEIATDVVFSADQQSIVATLEGLKGDKYLAITILQASDGTAVFTKFVQQSTPTVQSLPAKTSVNSMISLKNTDKIVIGFTYQESSNKLAFGIFNPSGDTFIVQKNTYYTEAQVLTLVADELISNSQYFHFISYVNDPAGDQKYNYLVCYDASQNQFQDTWKVEEIQDAVNINKCLGIHFLSNTSSIFYSLLSYETQSAKAFYAAKIDLTNNQYFRWNLDHFNYQLLNMFVDSAIQGQKFYFIGSTKQFGFSPYQLYSYTFKVGIIGEFDKDNQYSLFDSNITSSKVIDIIITIAYDSNGGDDTSLYKAESWNLFPSIEINSSIQIPNQIIQPIRPAISWILTKENWYINRNSFISGSYSLPAISNVTCKEVAQPAFILTYNYTTNQDGFRYNESTRNFYINITKITNDLIIIVILEQSQQPPQYLKIYIQSSKNCTSATMSFNKSRMNYSSYLISDPLNWTYYNDSSQQYCPEVSYQLYSNGNFLRPHSYFNMIKIIDKNVILNISDISMCRSSPYYIMILGYVGLIQSKVYFFFNCKNDCVIQSQPDISDITYAIQKDGLKYYAIPKWEKNNEIYCTLEYTPTLPSEIRTAFNVGYNFVDFNNITFAQSNVDFCGEIQFGVYKNSSRTYFDDGLFFNDTSNNALKLFLASNKSHYDGQPYNMYILIYHKNFDWQKSNFFFFILITTIAIIRFIIRIDANCEYNYINISGSNEEATFIIRNTAPLVMNFSSKFSDLFNGACPYHLELTNGYQNNCEENVTQGLITMRYLGYITYIITVVDCDQANFITIPSDYPTQYQFEISNYSFIGSSSVYDFQPWPQTTQLCGVIVYQVAEEKISELYFSLSISNYCRDDENIVKPYFNLSEPNQVMSDITSWFTLIKATAVNSNCMIKTYQFSQVPAFTLKPQNESQLVFRNSPSVQDIDSGYLIAVAYTDVTGYLRTVTKFFDVVESCSQNVIKGTISMTKDYYYNSSSLDISLSEIGTTIDYCGNVSITLKHQPIITYNDRSYYNNNTKSLTLTFNETDVEYLKAKISYQIAQKMQIYEFTEFLKDPLCQVNISYELLINGLSQTPYNNFASIKLNNQTQKPQLQIFSSNNDLTLLSPFLIEIKGSLVNYDNSVVTDYLKIELTLLQQNINPPDFIETPPQEFVFNTMISQVLQFPEFQDADGDKIASVTVNFGILKQYITGEFPTFKINPGFNSMGEYPIIITVQDNNSKPLSRVFKFKLKIQRESVEIPNNEETPNNNEGEGNNENSGNTKDNLMIINNPSQISQDLDARIKSISNQGVVKLKFNDPGQVSRDIFRFMAFVEYDQYSLVGSKHAIVKYRYTTECNILLQLDNRFIEFKYTLEFSRQYEFL
eukprot:403376719